MTAAIIVIVVLRVMLVAAAVVIVAENGVCLRVRPMGMINRHALGLVQSLWTIPTTIVTCGTRSATIMDLKDNPHPNCCISHPGEIGNPWSNRTAEQLPGVVYLFIRAKTLTHLACLNVNDSAYTACRMTRR